LILILLACVQPCLIMVLPCISLRVTVSLDKMAQLFLIVLSFNLHSSI
jgi:hypothetical protein